MHIQPILLPRFKPAKAYIDRYGAGKGAGGRRRCWHPRHPIGPVSRDSNWFALDTVIIRSDKRQFRASHGAMLRLDLRGLLRAAMEASAAVIAIHLSRPTTDGNRRGEQVGSGSDRRAG